MTDTIEREWVGVHKEVCQIDVLLSAYIANSTMYAPPGGSKAFPLTLGDKELQAGKTDDGLGIDIPLLVSQDAAARPGNCPGKGVEG